MPDVGMPGARTMMVRLWFEDSPDVTEQEWRGEVRDVITGRMMYFRRLEGLVDTLTELLGDVKPGGSEEES